MSGLAQPAPLAAPARTRGAVGLAPLWLSLGAALVLRLPLLLRPDANSDAAVVGLQARHLLAGEWSKFLWGTPYRSSLDAVAAALGILLAGARPLALVVVPVVLHLALIALAWGTLRPRFARVEAAAKSAWTAALCTLPLVIPVAPLNTPITSATRAPCLALVFAALFLIDGADRSRRPLVRLAAGAALALFACGNDLFALQFLPALLLLALGFVFDGHDPNGAAPDGRGEASRRSRAMALGAGLLLGAALFAWLRAGGASEAARLDLRDLARHAGLLRACLAFVLGAEPLGGAPPPRLWAFSPLVAIRHAGCWLLFAALLAGMPLALARAIPTPLRRLGAAGSLTAWLSLAGFLCSPLSIDAWSARYLSTILLAAPFALAPLCALITTRRLALALAPWAAFALASSFFALGGAGAFQPLPLDGLTPDDRALREVLREQESGVALAQYWVAYRLAFLFEENPPLAPVDPPEDRYPPWRERWSGQRRFAVVIDPLEPRATEAALTEYLHMQAMPFRRQLAGRYVLLWVERR